MIIPSVAMSPPHLRPVIFLTMCCNSMMPVHNTSAKGLTHYLAISRSLFSWWCTMLEVISQLFGFSFCSFLSSSTLEQCTRNGSTLEPTLDCSKKITVALTMDGGQESTETFEFSVDSINDSSGDEYILESPMSIICNKTVPYYTYELRSKQRFYYRAFEETIVNKSVFSGCVDSATSSDPTCGHVYDSETGSRVFYSQGFCCTCTTTEFLSSQDPLSRMKVCFISSFLHYFMIAFSSPAIKAWGHH